MSFGSNQPQTSSSYQPAGIQPGGRIVLFGATTNTNCSHTICLFASTSHLVGLQANGAIDPSFGDGGRINVDFGLGDATRPPIVDDAIVQADGKILLALSRSGTTIIVVRLLPDGQLDPSFGDGGIASVTGPEIRSPRNLRIAQQSNGEIIVAGSTQEASNGSFVRLILMRLKDDGTVDPTFGVGGFHTEPGTFSGSVSDVLIDPQDRILTGENWFVLGVVRRFDANGDLDPGFGTEGTAVLDNGPSGPTPGPRLVISPRDSEIFALKSRLWKLSADGTSDQAFGQGGSVDLTKVTPYDTPDLTALTPSGTAVLPTADGGAIVAAGWPAVMEVARLSATGIVDPSFGNSGLARTYPLEAAGPPTLIQQSADRFLWVSGSYGALVARYRLDDGPPNDLDADRTVDEADRCPGRFGDRTSFGCNPYARTLTLKVKGRRARGLLVQEQDPSCVDEAGRVLIYQRKRGRDRRIGKSKLLPRDRGFHYFSYLKGKSPDRVYALLKRGIDPEVGACLKAKSMTIRR